MRIRNANWMYSTTRVTDSTSGQLFIDPPVAHEARYGFYLEGLLSELDAPGEFFYNPQSKMLYIVPTRADVSDRLQSSQNKPDVRIVFANAGTAIKIGENTRNLHIKNLDIRHWSTGIACGRGVRNLRISDMDFQNIFYDGINCWSAADYVVVNNTFAR